MLPLYNELVAILEAAARPIPPRHRPLFLERVAELVKSWGCEPGAGVYSRAAAQAQRELLNAPVVEVDAPHRTKRLPPRSPYRRRG